jgi:RNA polymerase-binding transcription factor DksA
MRNNPIDLNHYRSVLISRNAELKLLDFRNSDAASIRTLKQIEYALWRMERGRYGMCLKCEEQIDQKHLDTLPWALFCETCQETVDLLHHNARTLVRQHVQAIT